jgi:hypothetical protein
VKIETYVKTALDELRMQMLGTQVLLGFQLQSAFQDAFGDIPRTVKYAHVCALYLIVLTIALLIAVPSQHRFVEKGKATRRIARQANVFAELALVTFAFALGCAVYAVSAAHWLAFTAAAMAAGLAAFAALAWFAAGRFLNKVDINNGKFHMPEETPTPLHAKIEQMLTEARVVLPGAQALLGFQFIATLTKAFGDLPLTVRTLHFSALLAVAVSVIILLAPAAIHRITYRGTDVQQFHTIGSRLVAVALAPLAYGISADVYVATIRMLGDKTTALAGATVVAGLLFGLWYLLPLSLRR